jgi:hypothetical protein
MKKPRVPGGPTPNPDYIHNVCLLVEQKKEISAKLRGLEMPLRTDARNRFRKKLSLHRVVYKVYRSEKGKEYVVFYELGRNERIMPVTNVAETALLSFKASRYRAQPKASFIAVIRDRSWTTRWTK